MSNHLAVAAVTAALKQMVQDALDADVPGAKAQVGRPAIFEGDGNPTANLFLYHVLHDQRARNLHLPSRGRDGSRRGPSIAAIDLYYLISFYGSGSDYAPERLLGAVVRALEDRPIISPSIVERTIEEANGTLDAADLQRAPEPVRIIPTGLTLDELSKLWSVLLQVPYVLSVAYKCEIVYLETVEAGSRGRPVTSVGGTVYTLGGPAIDGVEPAGGPGTAIVWDGAVVIRGRGLDRSDLTLRLDGRDLDLSLATRITRRRIETPLSAATLGRAELAAGPVAIEALLPPTPGAPAHLIRITDRAGFTLRPKVSLPANAVDATGPAGQPVDGKVNVNFTPKVTKGQQVQLLLDELAPTSPVSTQLHPDPVDPSTFPVAQLTFSFKGVKRADYHLQARVDDVASSPDIDLDPNSSTYRQIIGPTVTIP
jgi:hypothetical protein